jgi:histone deacetylase 6
MTDEEIQDSYIFYTQQSLYICKETFYCAKLSAGAVIATCEAVCKGEARNGLAIVRPPGHHAEPDQAMGFCFFNNVAIAAKEMQRKGLAKKVMILDW